MARKKLEVCQKTMEQAVAEVEKNGSLATQSDLFIRVAKWYNGVVELRGMRTIEPGVVRLRILEYNISIKTQPGKRGRPGGNPTLGQNRTTRAEKFEKSQEIQDALKILERATEKRFRPIVKKIANGSMAAAVRLNCIECVGGETAEVRRCELRECAMWIFRPYQ